VRDSIQSLKSSGRTILLCTHNLAEAEELADNVAIIRQGRIFLEGPSEQIKSQLLGPDEYEARLACQLNGWNEAVPEGVELRSFGEDWIRFRIALPEQTIPILLRQLLDSGLAVISFQKIPRSLEQAFIQAMGSAGGEINGQ
jgi:ABC-2 type transport system ATP-binding protein